MRLPKASYKWALNHLISEGDSDIFPRPFEIDAFRFAVKDLLAEAEKIEIEHHLWNGGRRFVVPHQKFGFRRATQLDPLDSLIFAAIVRKHGAKIEKRRIPEGEKRVFSYRFDPQADGRLYGRTSNWHSFWQASLEKAEQEHVGAVAITDITDFYNQIYHHVVEGELRECKLEKSVQTALLHMLSALSDTVSQGVPVGPHAAHLLAECSLIPLDRSLCAHGFDFARYVDDVHFFCLNEKEAEICIHDFAEMLDKHGHLTIQRQKTDILDAEEFRKIARKNLVDRPLNDDEDKILKVIQKAGGGDPDPYEPISLEEIDEEGWAVVNSNLVSQLIDLYLAEEPINYARLGWLLRRLTQVGAPGGLRTVINNLDPLSRILGDVARYIRSASGKVDYAEDLGAGIIEALSIPLVRRSEYLSIVLLNLFSQQPRLDHLDRLLSGYGSATPAARRELILAAGAARAGYWIKERKGEFGAGGDAWLRRALIAASSSLAGDEGDHWLRKLKAGFSLEERLVHKWAPEKKSYKRKPPRVRIPFSDPD